MKKKLLIGWLLGLFLHIIHADNLQDFLQKLSKPSYFSANFKQEKIVIQLNKPMISSGEFIYSKDKGILWRIKKPVQGDVIVTDKNLIQKTNRTQTKINFTNNPYKAITSLTNKLMAGDEQSLKQTFIIQDIQKLKHGWQLTLIPKDKNLKQLFSKVVIKGDQYIEQIKLEDANHASTFITLSHHQNRPITEAEDALFKIAQ